MCIETNHSSCNCIFINVLLDDGSKVDENLTCEKNGEKPISCQPNSNCCVEKRRNSNCLVQFIKRKCKFWNRNQLKTILILSLVEFFAAAVVSIQAPFYPNVARQKGAAASEYGLVFGIFEIIVFIVSPIYGAKMDLLKPKRVFNCGILATGVCCVIFGLLDKIEGRVAFIWSCVVVRVVAAMGDAAFDTASFTIIAMEFGESVGTSFAMLEISFGLGLIVGPALGGVLYEIGGYQLPFLTMGGLLFTAALSTYIFLPEPGQQKTKLSNEPITEPCKETIPITLPVPVFAEKVKSNQEASPVARGGFQIFRLLQIPEIAITAYSIVAATAGVGFLSANLDYHLEKFQLSKVEVGAVFIMNGGVYAITAPIWGYICDHTEHQKTVTFAGAVFIILGFTFIGPVPFIPYDTTMSMTCLGLALFGFGLAATLVSAFLQMLNDAIANGYPDDISTYGLVSGLWTSMSALGYFIGPTVGGVSADWFGFRWSSILIIGGQLILVILLCLHFVTRRRHSSCTQQPNSATVAGKLADENSNEKSKMTL